MSIVKLYYQVPCWGGHIQIVYGYRKFQIQKITVNFL